MSESPNGSPFSIDRIALIGIIVLTIMVSALAMSPSVADPDLWGHVQFGRDVIRDGAIAETNPYTFTSPDYRWINHENLSEIVMAWTVDNFGNAGLLWGKLGLALFVIASILLFNLRRGVGVIASCLLTILVAWNLGYHWSFRPQLSSFVFFTLLILLLQFSFHYWRDNWHFKWFKPQLFTRGDSEADINYSWKHSRLLWIAPLIIAIWTNSHGGFVAGLCILCAYLGLRAIEAVSTKWPNGWGYARRMGLMIAAAVAAIFLNPYSHRLPMWLIESLGSPRPEILDWSSEQLYSMIGVKFWVLILVVVGSLSFSRKSLDFTQTILLGLTLWQAVSHFRHVPFFAILAGFWIGPHLQSVITRWSGEGVAQFSLATSRLKQVAVAAIMMALVGLIGLRLSERLTSLRVEKDVFPVDAFQYMSDHQLGGRLVVTYDWAQYAIGAFCVDENLSEEQAPMRVAFDGRFRTCYPQEVVDMHFDLLFANAIPRHRSSNSPPCEPGRVLDFGQPNLVLVRRIGELSEQVMNQKHDKWVLLYQDRLAQLWGRRTDYDDPQNLHFLAEHDRKVSQDVPSGFTEWPALPKQSKNSLNSKPTSLADAEH